MEMTHNAIVAQLVNFTRELPILWVTAPNVTSGNRNLRGAFEALTGLEGGRKQEANPLISGEKVVYESQNAG
jgi:hypothetical protein